MFYLAAIRAAQIALALGLVACGAKSEKTPEAVADSAEAPESPESVSPDGTARLSIRRESVGADKSRITLTLANTGTKPYYYYGDQGMLIPDREKFTPFGWFRDPMTWCGTGCGIHVLKAGASISVDVTDMLRKDLVTRFSVCLRIDEDGGESFVLKSAPIASQD